MWIASRQNMWETISKDPGVRAANCKATMTTNNSHRSWVYRKRMLEDASLLKIWPPRKQTSWTEQCYVILNGIRSKIVTNAGSTKNARVFIFVCKSILILTYAILTSHKPVVLTPYEKWSFLGGFRPGPICFQPKPLTIANLVFNFSCLGHHLGRILLGRMVPMCFFWNALRGDGFRSFNFFGWIFI